MCYRATDRPAQIIIGGASLGGLQAAFERIPGERTAIKIDTKVYDDYVGQYESAIFDFEVVKDGERLMAVPKERTTTRTSQGRPPAELFPESDAISQFGNRQDVQNCQDKQIHNASRNRRF